MEFPLGIIAITDGIVPAVTTLAFYYSLEGIETFESKNGKGTKSILFFPMPKKS